MLRSSKEPAWAWPQSIELCAGIEVNFGRKEPWGQGPPSTSRWRLTSMRRKPAMIASPSGVLFLREAHVAQILELDPGLRGAVAGLQSAFVDYHEGRLG